MSAEALRALIPLPDDKPVLLTRLVEGLDPAALHWLSGYAAGLAAAQSLPNAALALPAAARDAAAAAPVPLVGIEAAPQLTVVYGSQTGNAKRVAESLAREVENAGLAVRLLRADAYPLRELKAERLLYVVISTQGDGDPPDDARGFVEFLASKRAPKLPQLKFAVIGLGDSSYPQFCAIGAKIDARLAELGAARLFERGEADLDIVGVAAPWSKKALE